MVELYKIKLSIAFGNTLFAEFALKETFIE